MQLLHDTVWNYAKSHQILFLWVARIIRWLQRTGL